MEYPTSLNGSPDRTDVLIRGAELGLTRPADARSDWVVEILTGTKLLCANSSEHRAAQTRWLNGSSTSSVMKTATAVGIILYLVAAWAVVSLYETFHQRQRRKGAKLPPGPKGRPVVGNLFDLPHTHTFVQFKKWSETYGPLFRLNIVGWNHVVLSTERAASDLLSGRGSIYSGRAGLTAASELLADNKATLLLPDNELWRRNRRFVNSVTSARAASECQAIQSLESVELVARLLVAPALYQQSFDGYAGGTLLRLAMGKKYEDNPGHVQRILTCLHIFERVAAPGAYLVDLFPSLLKVPKWLAPFKRELAKLHQYEFDTFRALQTEIRKEMQAGVAPACWQRTFLETQDQWGLTDDEGAFAVGTTFAAGSGTTSATLQSFVLAMVHHPQWQRRLHEELDRHVGSSRLPSFEDMPNLPTVRAVVKETLRWRPPVAGGVPHQLVQDDIYQGYFLPAGSLVHANQWAIHRDPDLYPLGDSFNPDRWLQPSYPTYREPLTLYPNLAQFSAFGYGRRFCPGVTIAEQFLYIAIARIAWTCDITPKRDKNTGRDVPVPMFDYTGGLTNDPKPFIFDLEVRHQHRSDELMRALEKGRQEDPLRSV